MTWKSNKLKFSLKFDEAPQGSEAMYDTLVEHYLWLIKERRAGLRDVAGYSSSNCSQTRLELSF